MMTIYRGPADEKANLLLDVLKQQICRTKSVVNKMKRAVKIDDETVMKRD